MLRKQDSLLLTSILSLNDSLNINFKPSLVRLIKHKFTRGDARSCFRISLLTEKSAPSVLNCSDLLSSICNQFSTDFRGSLALALLANHT